MSTKNDGGPASPVYESNVNGHIYCTGTGMSLRDRFAIAALSGVPMPQGHMHDTAAAYERIASHCFKMADAMLKAREA